jgi:hypothetical protein
LELIGASADPSAVSPPMTWITAHCKRLCVCERERRTVSGFLLGVWLLIKICKLNGKKIIQMEKFGGAFTVDLLWAAAQGH